MPGKTDTVQAPDPPLRRVPLIPGKAATVVTRKRVVEVMVPSSEHQECEPPIVAGGVPSRIRLRANRMARRVNQKGNMLEQHHPQESAPEETVPGPSIQTPDHQR